VQSMAEMKTETRVFLSFAHQDRKFADRLTSALQKRGVVVWIDHHNLTAGTPDWEKSIRQEIGRCDAVILAASPSVIDSQYVKDELSIASDCNKPVVPAWVSGERWSDCAPLGRISTQYADCRGKRFKKGVDELVIAIWRKLGERPEVQPSILTQRSRMLVGTLGMTIVASIFLAAGYLFRSSQKSSGNPDRDPNSTAQIDVIDEAKHEKENQRGVSIKQPVSFRGPQSRIDRCLGLCEAFPPSKQVAVNTLLKKFEDWLGYIEDYPDDKDTRERVTMVFYHITVMGRQHGESRVRAARRSRDAEISASLSQEVDATALQKDLSRLSDLLTLVDVSLNTAPTVRSEVNP